MKNILIIFILSFLCISNVFAKSETLDDVKLIKEFRWNAPREIHELFKSYFFDFQNKAYDPISFKLKIDQVNRELFTMGYYDSSLSFKVDGSVVSLNFKIGTRTNFYFKGNQVYSFQELKNKITEKVKSDLGKIDLEQFKIVINELYEDIGMYGTKVEIVTLDGVDRDKTKIKSYILNISEGEKIPMEKISFRGNNALTTEALLAMYEDNGTNLVKTGYYDRNYLEKFTNIIKKKYLSLGYVYVEVSRARITSQEEEPIEVEYLINEKSQFNINKINIQNVSGINTEELKSLLINHEGQPINIPELEGDFKKIVNYLQDKGYYFAYIANLNSEGLLKYDSLNTQVDLNIIVNQEKKICFNEAIINGNFKTQSEVIKREVNFSPEELIVPSKLESIRQKLSGLGLFSNLRITPYMIYEDKPQNECNRANLIIQVKERDFGLVELTPGFRTDLGAKMAVGLTYNNLGGMNRSVAIKAQGNQRFNLDSLDERRRLEDVKRFEYTAKVSFTEPYLMYSTIGTQVEFEVSTSAQKKRFSSFDAEIFRVSPQLSKNFNKNLSTTVKYQLEKINQYDATESKDNDNFTIGSMTPSITLDFRDDPINPHKGTYFNIASEWANHYFGSMKSLDFEVNYLKLTSRNKFYFTLGNFTFATSITGGYEKNYAEKFYIPSIKVFRLDGFDEIRGYEDSEINRLTTGTEISKIVVGNKAYYVAFKFEPRYNLSDNMQLDVFFDAGRVFVNKFQPLDLRTSVGAGFKILTPVGSLDFDYGVKLKRVTYPDNARDAFGRFHLSIGFF